MPAKTITGGCFCGAIRWEAANLFDAGYCHCSICRRISGAPVFAFASFKVDDFRLTRGSPKTFASSDTGRREFCGDCGSAVYFHADGWPYVSVGIGSFDNPNDVRPTMHQCEADRLAWFDTTDNLPRFRTNKNISHPRERIRP